MHVANKYIERVSPEERLFDFTASQFVCAIKRALTLLSIDGAHMFTPKAFRAGRATELASKGVPIGQILKAGEWRSSAFLRYVDEDVVDASSFVHEIIDSEEEIM
jgi:hypothetical protein